MRRLVKRLAILGLTGAVGLAAALPPAGRDSRPPSPAAKGTSFAAEQVPWRDGAYPKGTSFGAHPEGTSFGAPSLLEPAARPGHPDELFAMMPPAPPGRRDLLLGALLTGGFIARRRLRAD